MNKEKEERSEKRENEGVRREAEKEKEGGRKRERRVKREAERRREGGREKEEGRRDGESVCECEGEGKEGVNKEWERRRGEREGHNVT
jgi:hypothetical protein